MTSKVIAKHYVVFDGTSAYVCPFEDLTDEVDVLDKFDNFDEASNFCDAYNDSNFAIN